MLFGQRLRLGLLLPREAWQPDLRGVHRLPGQVLPPPARADEVRQGQRGLRGLREGIQGIRA